MRRSTVFILRRAFTDTTLGSSFRPLRQSGSYRQEKKKRPLQEDDININTRTTISSSLGEPLKRLIDGDLTAIDACRSVARSNKQSVKRIFGYNTIMQKLLAQAKNSPKAVSKCLELYREISSTPWIGTPTTMTYNLAMNAHVLKSSRVSDEVDIAACLDLLDKMKKSRTALPDKFSYSTVINALTKSKARSLKSTADLCVKLLEEMKTLAGGTDRIAYNTVLRALALVEEDPESVTAMCMQLFKEMKGDEKLKPDSVTHSAILSRLAYLAGKGQEESVERMMTFLKEIETEANVFHYNIVMSALVRRAENGNISASDRILTFLGEMAVAENSAARPDVITYNTAINYMVKLVNEGDRSAAEKCLILLREMTSSGEASTRPDIITYSTIMKAYAKLTERGDISALTVSLALFEEMKREKILPDIFVYSVILQTLSYAVDHGYKPAVQKCFDVLEEMKATENVALLPNTIIYTKVLHILVHCANNGDPTAIDRALLMLDEMKASPRSQPDVVAYTCVISALAKQIGSSEDKMDVMMDRIIMLLSNMQSSPKLTPNYITFSTILWPLLKLIETGSDAAFDRVLELIAISQTSGCSKSNSSSSENSENAFLMPMLKTLRILANKHDESVVDKTTLFLKTLEKHNVSISSLELGQAEHCIQTIFKALSKTRPAGNTSELHRIDRSWKPLELLSFMEQSKMFKPSTQLYNSVLLGLIRRAKNSRDMKSRETCLEIVKEKMIPSSNFDAKSLLLAIDAMTSLPVMGVDPNVILNECLSLMNKTTTERLVRFNNMDVFECLVKYCLEAFSTCDINKCPQAVESIILKLNNIFPKNSEGSVFVLRLLRVLHARSGADGSEFGDVFTAIFDLGHKEKLYRADAAHLVYIVREKSKSFTSIEDFLRGISQSDLKLYIDSQVIYELFLSICNEKHRTEPEEIKRRLSLIAKYMNQLNLPLTVSQESILKHYHLLDDFLGLVLPG